MEGRNGNSNLGLDIVGNPRTNMIKSYLSCLDQGELSKEVILQSLQKLVKDFPLEKHLIHTQLLLYTEVDPIKDLRGLPELKPLVSLMCNGYPPEFYIDLVFELDLHAEFIDLLCCTRGKSFAKTFLEIGSPRLGSAFQNGKLSAATIEQYLLALGKLSRGEDHDQTQIFYSNLFDKLLYDFKSGNSECSETGNNVTTLLKIIGVAVMQEDDCVGENEIADLSQAYHYNWLDSTPSKSREIFEIVFADCKLPKCLPVSGDVLKSLQYTFADVIDKIILLPSNTTEKICLSTSLQECSLEVDVTKNTPAALTGCNLEVVGIFGYLAQRLLGKYCFQITGDYMVTLKRFAEELARHKPKLTVKELKSEIANFEVFCDYLGKYGGQKWYQQDWFDEFLKYPNIWSHECGLQAVENLLVKNADINTATVLAESALVYLTPKPNPSSASKLGQPEKPKVIPHSSRVKSALLNLLRSEGLKNDRDQWIQTIFDKGVHSTFAQDDFSKQMNLILTKMKSIEEETDSKCIYYDSEIIYCLCFQDSLKATHAILQASLRTHYFKLLNRTSVFLSLPCIEAGTKSTVFETVLHRMLDFSHELDPIIESIANGLPALISNGVAPFETVYQILISAIEKSLLSDKFEKLVKLVEIYDHLIRYLLTTVAVMPPSIFEFIRSLLLFTYIRVENCKFPSFIQIREKCLALEDYISRETLQPKSVEALCTTKGELNGMTLMELGFAYVRSGSKARAQIKEYFGSPENRWKYYKPSPLYYSVVQTMMAWVSNTCTAEWNGLLTFVMTILLKRTEYANFSIYQLVNDSTLAAKKEWECRITYFLTFYKSFLSFVQKSEDEKFHENITELKQVFKTLVIVMLSHRESRQKPNARKVIRMGQIFQRVLIVLSDFSKWVVENCEKYDESLKDDCLKYLIWLQPFMTGRSSHVIPLYRFVLEILTDNDKANPPPNSVLQTGFENTKYSTPVCDQSCNSSFELSTAAAAKNNGRRGTGNLDMYEENETGLYAYKRKEEEADKFS